MPELPEVETVRQKLRSSVLNKKITDVSVFVDRIIRTPDVSSFKHKLLNQTIKEIKRLGKHLIFVFDNFYIVSHLRMEGKYEFVSDTKPFNKHDHVIFHFTDGSELRYNDVRKFGTMDLVSHYNEVKSVAELGVEPLDTSLTIDYLENKLSKNKTTIKKALLDQSIIAGLGNIYVDEVLFFSKIHPERSSLHLTIKEIQKLIDGIKTIIDMAIKNGGSSVRSYSSLGDKGSMQDLHKIYGKKGFPCIRCSTAIEKIKVAGRGTHFCPKCQKK